MAPEVSSGRGKEAMIARIQDGGSEGGERMGRERSVFALLQDGGHLGRGPWLRPAASAPPPAPPTASSQSGVRAGGGSVAESELWAFDMAAAAATAATKGNGGGGARAGAGEASGARKKKGPGPLATAYLVIYNVVMTAG